MHYSATVLAKIGSWFQVLWLSHIDLQLTKTLLYVHITVYTCIINDSLGTLIQTF